ncbi:hypothetical protein E4K72_15240 [Oxalobacteraceae bacterium OM1]|nr:hypothetical protein E4K72_15240 [Oxalobacteraceae bacterium OM1]
MAATYATPTLVMTIERPYFAAILAVPRRKHIEYRSLTPYWLSRMEKVGQPPFNLRLINGMSHPIPEATVRVDQVVRDEATQTLEFHLGAVLEVKNWDRRLEKPTEAAIQPLTMAAERGVADVCIYACVERSAIDAALADEGWGALTLPSAAQASIDAVSQAFDDDLLFLLLLADRACPTATRWVAIADGLQLDDDGTLEITFTGFHELESVMEMHLLGKAPGGMQYAVAATPAFALGDPAGILERLASRLAYVRAYSEALNAVADDITDAQFELLIAHYERPGMCASFVELAADAGYTSAKQAKMDYAALGNLVAKALMGFAPDKGIGALAGRIDEADPQGSEQWLLYFEVARAMERLGWVGAEEAGGAEEDGRTEPVHAGSAG